MDTDTHMVDNFPNELLDGLNEPQRTAVTHKDGPLLVLAGAGTGKTKVLTSRIAHLISYHHIPPHRILAVTFTNKAAQEMKARIRSTIGSHVDNLHLGTFHAIAAKILRRHAPLVGLKENYVIVDIDDQVRLIRQLSKDLSIDDKKWSPKALLSIISRFKDRGLTPEKLDYEDVGALADGKLKLLFSAYQERLLTLNAVDFGNLLLHNLTLLNEHPEVLSYYQNMFSYILVDEYQDTNITQYLWLRLLAAKHHNISCVGDDDQSIYGWRGAEVGNILRFEQDFPGAIIVRLEQNYRSTSQILSASSGLIAHNKHRLGKTLWTSDKEGEPIKLLEFSTDKDEARYIAQEIESLQHLKKHSLNDIAILVRASFQTRIFEEVFTMHRTPYQIIGGVRFYERLEVKDMVAYLRLTKDLQDDLAFERVINTPKRGIGPAKINHIYQEAKCHSIPLSVACKRLIEQGEIKGQAKLALEGFFKLLEKWKDQLAHQHPSTLIEPILKESGYKLMLQSDYSTESDTRLENIYELATAMKEFENLESFLDHISLVADIDTFSEQQHTYIMTLHAAKGLEFDTVFLPGWEEGIFPSRKTVEESMQAGVEEERRLAYVGITRAKKRCYISYAHTRRIYQNFQTSLPSRFTEELPTDAIETISHVHHYTPSYTSTAKKPMSVYENTPTSDSERIFRNGNRVFHQKFGYGTVRTVEDNVITIAFDKAGLKCILEEYIKKVKS